MKTYRSKPKLEKAYADGKYKEGKQRYLVVRTLVASKEAQSLDSLVSKLDGPAYWSTLRHRNQRGEPSKDSWFVQLGGGVPKSIAYHLRALEKDELVDVRL